MRSQVSDIVDCRYSIISFTLNSIMFGIAQSACEVCKVHVFLLCHNAVHCREQCLRQQGFVDIFKDIKATENDKALALLPGILK